MKHLKLFFALFAMLALGVTNAWGALTEEYSYTFTSKQFSDNSTAKKLGTVTWTPATTWSYGTGYWGNDATKGQQWGSSSNTLNKMILTSGTSFSNVKKIEINASIASDGGCKLSVKVGNTTIGTTKTLTKTATAYTFEDANGLTGAVEITLSNGSKKKAQYIKSIKIYTESSAPEKVLSSIEISGDLTNKTYEEGEELDLAGLTVTAKYDDKSEEDVTKDVEWSYTPNPLTKGTTSVDVTATYEDKTATKTINGLTVNEHIVTPGAYDITLNNVLFGTTASANITGPVTGKQNDITITINGTGSTKPRTDATYTRFYASSTMAISVPSGYVIKSIAITKNESDYAAPSVNVGTFDASTKTWTGTANSVTMSFSAKSFINSIKVTYVADVKYALNITTPSNGTLVVKEGSTVLTDGAQVYEGTKLVVTPTPNAGYVFESLTVGGEAVELTDGTYTFNMPAANVTIAATFKESAKPDATLTLSKNGDTSDKIEGKAGDVINLPTFKSECSKTFVGWDSKSDCAVAPEYAPGAEYTLAAGTQILYAVYADGESGGSFTITKTMSDIVSDNDYTVSANNTATCYTSLALDENITLSTTGQANCGSFWNDPRQWRLYQNKSGNAIVTASNGFSLTSVKFTFTVTEGGTLLNNGIALESGKAVTASGTSVTYLVGDTEADQDKGQVRITAIEVSYSKEGEYSNYSTTCAAAPTAEVDPTSVTATATETTGKLTVTYDNVNTEDVKVALYNDAACTEEFTAGWLTVSLDGDKNVTYTVSANTLYTERKAYIKLTAPETTGATDPAVVVVPVTQAGKDKVFASLEALLAAITPTEEGVEVTVTLTNEIIVDFYTSGSHRNGVKLNIPYQGNTKAIEIYCKDVPAEWVKGGKLSGTITCPWKLYNSTWELCPTAWTELTYAAPPTVSSIAVSGTPTKTIYIDGEEFDPAGLVVTATYTDASTEVVNAALVDWTFNPEILTKGLTSVQVTATYNKLTSAAYSVNVTVNDIPTKTVAEFIAAEGGRCYLEGIVSNISNTTYGNFDLTDASGKIYIYGCLNAAGEEKKFADLGVKNGDKIKVIADEYKLYEGTKQEAIDVQYVSHISAATITIADITMEVGETKTIAATVVPAETEVTYTIKENAANAISLSDNVITALAEGTATITATVAEGATYLSNSVDFTVTVTPQNIATLPFAFDGGVNDIKNTLGMSQKNLGTDYGSSPKLKFDDKDDYVIIHFNERPGILTYDIKANTGSGAFSGEFAVQESADGVTYRNLAVYETISGSKESKAHNCFDKDTRYIKFIFATKDNGNVALGNIKIEKSETTLVSPSVESGIFSVAAGKYVQFSTGNLQYEVGTNTWSFASEQYEVIGGEAYTGSNNTNYGMNVPGYTGKLDLFGWSSDGKFGVNPSNTDADYGDAADFVDWGNLVDDTGWYTLTKDEMNYILNRKKDGKKLWALATVCGMNGLILLPDNWNTSITLEYGYIPANFNYTKNQLDAAAWAALEAAGAVFLPEGGTRVGGYGNKEQGGGPAEFDSNGDYFHVDNVGEMGYYWLNTQDARADYENCASYLILPGWSEGSTNADNDDVALAPQVWSREKRRGNSVRLVKAIEPNYTRDNQSAGVYGTVCYPENIVWCDGATLYEVAGKEGNKVIFDEVTTPEAGMPYIFIAEKEKVNFFCGSATATEAGEHNSLQGTFTQIDPAVDNILVGNYMLVNNIIKKCGINCGLYANRAYFVADDLEKMDKAPAAAPGRRRISLDVTSENTTTGLDNITNGEDTTIKVIENGQLIIIRNGEKYNAMGVKF